MTALNRVNDKLLQTISYATAAKGMLLLSACTIIFHLLIVIGVIPYTIVWGGRLTNSAEMLQFETVSIAINLLIMLLIAMEAGYIRRIIPQKVIGIVLWGIFILFVANTVANLFSVTIFERIVFTPLTFLLALLTYCIIKHRQRHTK